MTKDRTIDLHTIYFFLMGTMVIIFAIIYVNVRSSQLTFTRAITRQEGNVKQVIQTKISEQEAFLVITRTYESVLTQQEELAGIQAAILELWEAEKSAIICSRTNEYFNLLNEKNEKEYTPTQLAFQDTLVKFEREYQEYVQVIEEIPRYAGIARARAEAKFEEMIEPLNVQVLSARQAVEEINKELNTVLLEGKALADKLYERDIQEMPGVLNAEGGSTPVEEQVYIMKVIENRILSPNFPYAVDVHSVIHAPLQYSTVSSGAYKLPVPESVWNTADLYLRGKIKTDMPDNVLYQARFQQPGKEIWKIMSSGHYFCFA